MISRKKLCLYTAPIICGELIEECLFMTDAVFLSFKGEVFLAAIGVIDAFFLLCIAYGVSLNDSLQNFYSRHLRDDSLQLAVFKRSFMQFIISSVVSAGLGAILSLAFIPLFCDNIICDLFFKSLPLLFGLILVTNISLCLNSLLMGRAETKTVGFASVSCVIVNALLGYIGLFVLDLGIDANQVILATSIIAELLSVIMMSVRIIKIYQGIYCGAIKLKGRLMKSITKVSFIPALSGMAFHVGSLLLFLYCSVKFDVEQTALLSLAMAYWGILQVPAEGFSETALNFYARIYSKKYFSMFKSLSHRLIECCWIISSLLLLVIVLVDLIVFGGENLMLIGVLAIIVAVNSVNEILSMSLISRLENYKLAIGQIIFAIIVVVFILMLTNFVSMSASMILLSLLIGHIALFQYLSYKNKMVWAI